MKKTRSERHLKSHWFTYLVVFFVALILLLFVFILFVHKPQTSLTETSSLPTNATNSLSQESQPATQETETHLEDRAPYSVDLASLFTNDPSLTFRPKGTAVGTLHQGLVVSMTQQGSTYTVRLAHSYHDATLQFNDVALYRGQVDNLSTQSIFVTGYGDSPRRTVKVNTALTLTEQLANTGKQFADWQGVTLYLFYAADGTLSLTLPDVHQGKTGSPIEFQQQKEP